MKQQIAETKNVAIEETIAATNEVVNETPTKVTKASKVRAMFVDGYSRKQISDSLGIRYQQVYQYTSAMQNEHHNDDSTGRAIIVTTESGEKLTRKDYVISELRKGRTRGNVAKELGIPYQVVYGYLKKANLLELGIKVADEVENVVADETDTK